MTGVPHLHTYLPREVGTGEGGGGIVALLSPIVSSLAQEVENLDLL